MALYETLLLRDVLRPLLAQLGARHRLPVDEVRAPITLRTKLVLFFSSVTVFTSGLVLLFALSPRHAPWIMLASIALALALALGLVLLIVRDMVNPVRALEERSDEMARGELARPVPPRARGTRSAGSRFALEEMRRALRDKLRSTEEVNLDLEREVQRRTGAARAANRELHEALEKLRRAQDHLVRSEKLASIGQLVAGIAHEINNPVNAIVNTVGPLEEAIQAMVAGATAAAAARGADEARGDAARRPARRRAHQGDRPGAAQLLAHRRRAASLDVDLNRSLDDSLELLRHLLQQRQGRASESARVGACAATPASSTRCS